LISHESLLNLEVFLGSLSFIVSSLYHPITHLARKLLSVEQAKGSITRMLVNVFSGKMSRTSIGESSSFMSFFQGVYIIGANTSLDAVCIG